MRIGLNPEKDAKIKSNNFNHQIIIPVYIPYQNKYFKDSFKILKACISSLLHTTNSQTFISLINNGSCKEVADYLDELFLTQKIHEVIHTTNIGKMNAIYKGLIGNDMSLITIADSDVLFLSGWQQETIKVFNDFPKTGTVGLTPQFNMFSNYCTNTIFDNLVNSSCKFYKVLEPENMWKFYNSLGWNMPKQHYYFNSILGIKSHNNLFACIGTGHYVATYRKELFETIKRNYTYKMGGDSERYLDMVPMLKGYWKLSTFKNYAFHMGNAWEEWMEKDENKMIVEHEKINLTVHNYHGSGKFSYFLKNKVFKKLLQINVINKNFLKFKKLSNEELIEYSKISY